MRILLIEAALLAALATAACGYVPARDDGPRVVAAPPGVRSGPTCRVWDEDIFGRRYCRVHYDYGTGS